MLFSQLLCNELRKYYSITINESMQGVVKNQHILLKRLSLKSGPDTQDLGP